MKTTRLEAFSDGVIAILITIMVLELKTPEDADWTAFSKVGPIFLAYLLSFVFLGIYWNNHHHMIHMTGTARDAFERLRSAWKQDFRSYESRPDLADLRNLAARN